MAEFVTADLHFGDLGMLGGRFVDRPFWTTRQMDRVMIDNWNRVVKGGDTVFVLGDMFAEKTWKKRRKHTFEQLNGTKVLVIGNHDDHVTLNLPWAGCHHSLVALRGGVELVMHHKPRPAVHGTVQLHGHIHSKEVSMPVYDVGVDAHDFTPIPMETLVAKAQAYQRGVERLARLQDQQA